MEDIDEISKICFEVGQKVEIIEEVVEKERLPEPLQKGVVVKTKNYWCPESGHISQHVYVLHENKQVLGWTRYEVKPLREGTY